MSETTAHTRPMVQSGEASQSHVDGSVLSTLSVPSTQTCANCGERGFADPARFRGSNESAWTPKLHQVDAIRDIAHAFVCDDVSRAKLVMSCGSGKTLTALWALQEIADQWRDDPTKSVHSVIVFVPSLPLITQLLCEWQEQWEDKKFRMEDVLTVCSDGAVHRTEGQRGEKNGTSRQKAKRKRNGDTHEDEDEQDDTRGMPFDAFEQKTSCKVTSESSTILEWLEERSFRDEDSDDCGDERISLILCTYQSSHKVKDALQGSDHEFEFDFGIFDEAHKTVIAGKNDRTFKLALTNENIRIKRRLFMTATPRITKARTTNNNSEHQFADDGEEIGTMCDDSHHGNTAHALSFRAAIDLGIICEYKILVVCVDETCAELHALCSGETSINGRQLPARHLAKALALKHACTGADDAGDTRPRKALTFHRLNGKDGEWNDAELTAASMESLAKTCMDNTEFEVLRISGAYNADKRMKIMRKYDEAERAILTNARALSEGVDIPVIDLVAFMSTKQSEVDIMQSAGRAMRLDPNNPKKVAYVLLPVFIPKDIHAKGNQDDTNSTHPDAELCGNSNEAKSIAQEPTTSAISLDRSTDQTSLTRAPETPLSACAQMPGAALDQRDELPTTKKRKIPNDTHKGPRTHISSLVGLASESTVACSDNTSIQSQNKNTAPSRRDASVGVPNTGKALTAINTEVLGVPKDYANVLAVFKAFCDNDYKFQEAMNAVRQTSRRNTDHGSSPLEQVVEAENMFRKFVHVAYVGSDGVNVDAEDIERAVRTVVMYATTSNWEEYYDALKRYKDGEGKGDPDCKVRFIDPDTGLEVGKWLKYQRESKKSGTLSADRVERLEKLGVRWDSWEASELEKYYDALKRYKDGEGKGDPTCPSRYVDPVTGLKVGKFLCRIRRKYKENKLSDDFKKRLDALGLRWEVVDRADWETHFEALKHYMEAHNGDEPPQKYKVDDLDLGMWLSNQRRKMRESPNDENVQRLLKLGVSASPNDDTWEKYYDALERYTNGPGKGDPNTCHHGIDDPETKLKVGIWLQNQRAIKKRLDKPDSKGKKKTHRVLTPERIKRLEKLGVRWNLKDYDEIWEKNFQSLKRYTEGPGEGDPNTCTKGCGNGGGYKDPDTGVDIGDWLRQQRSKKSKGKLKTDQIKRLEDLGVWWSQSGSQVAVELNSSKRFPDKERQQSQLDAENNLAELVVYFQYDYRRSKLKDVIDNLISWGGSSTKDDDLAAWENQLPKDSPLRSTLNVLRNNHIKWLCYIYWKAVRKLRDNYYLPSKLGLDQWSDHRAELVVETCRQWIISAGMNSVAQLVLSLLRGCPGFVDICAIAATDGNNEQLNEALLQPFRDAVKGVEGDDNGLSGSKLAEQLVGIE